MEISDYKTVGEWYDSMKAEGISVPLDACDALSQAMEKLNLTFQNAYNLFTDKDKLILVNRTFILDLSVRELWEAKAKPSRLH